MVRKTAGFCGVWLWTGVSRGNPQHLRMEAKSWPTELARTPRLAAIAGVENVAQ
jgi:hypothetical protein